MEYKIVCDQSPDLLARTVNEHLKQGWQPVGGPFLNPYHGAYDAFNQALIRRTESPQQWTEGGSFP
jgi:hypothetical protein